ncbi:putative membrane protein [Chitinophaga skermanii]|uniref:Protoporphyrinogen IX oxidase n=1 Tax=Chitinophaga skermanii TaxID=331697 RepID=A0A327Q4K0_9BACT|nr:CopD family protein [Chitinophaga skermanii]RAI98661.1 putative membrane protein [Chitinophaga skermanii]
MSFFYIKALHIIFIVTWFAGMFYIVRLFVYNTEANEKSEPEKGILQAQYKIMMKRLWYGITWPSAILTLILGPTTLYLYSNTIPAWMWAKLGFVLCLYAYHLFLHKIFKEESKGIFKLSSTQLRVWNEIATILLVAIVFLVVVKSLLSFVWGLIGLLAFTSLLMLAIKIYKRSRDKKSK